MARLPRLALPNQAHWLSQQAHSAGVAFTDQQDRAVYLDALLRAARAENVKVHAYALLSSEVHLVATPALATSLGRLMQAVGRHYVSAYHRRHGGSGTLWSGRFRSAVVQGGTTMLDVLCWVDSASNDPAHTSEPHRATDARHPMISDPPEYWALGNTPFERQLRWRERLSEGLDPIRRTALLTAARGGWAIGTTAFQQEVAAQTARPATPRPRGRPPGRRST